MALRATCAASVAVSASSTLRVQRTSLLKGTSSPAAGGGNCCCCWSACLSCLSCVLSSESRRELTSSPLSTPGALGGGSGRRGEGAGLGTDAAVEKWDASRPKM